MTKFLGKANSEELLILTKTYPVPSQNHREISCVAATNRNGNLRRLYPIPFRFLEKGKQFRRWSWIKAKIDKYSDPRPESYRIDIESIVVGNSVSTKNFWEERKFFIQNHIYESFEDLENARDKCISTIGFIRPTNLAFSLRKVDATWSEKEIGNLLKEGLFDSADIKKKRILKKLPYQFRYSFFDSKAKSPNTYDLIITDWEIGALYWRCVSHYGKEWEEYFRQKLEIEIPSKDLLLMLGTMRYPPSQWLIIGLFYPPKYKPGEATQPRLI